MLVAVPVAGERRPPRSRACVAALTWGCLCLCAVPSEPAAARQYPQYVLLNKAYGSLDPLAWNQDVPSSCSQASQRQHVLL